MSTPDLRERIEARIRDDERGARTGRTAGTGVGGRRCGRRVDAGRPGNNVNGTASFQSFGVGFISACPDPDGAGPEIAILKDTNGEGRNDLCFQSSYQKTGIAGTSSSMPA